jgi:ferric-dicitrate binding protein FerR (iron transport regulator)
MHPEDEAPAEMDMVIEKGTWIRTEGDSYAIISFADMTTFFMKPFTTVFIEYGPEHQTKLEILAGNVWGNIKKMMKDGSMNVTLNQAVAGAKGTTFVVEENGQVSTLKVIEGAMTFTSIATGETVEVTTGQMVSASAAGPSAITPFDAAQEVVAWPEVGNLAVEPDIAPVETGGDQPTGLFNAPILTLLLVLGAGVACLSVLGIMILAAIKIASTRRRR